MIYLYIVTQGSVVINCTCADLGGLIFSLFFFFNDSATTEIYTLSLHDALPILTICSTWLAFLSLASWTAWGRARVAIRSLAPPVTDRKSTRLNSSHDQISYADFCLKKKRKKKIILKKKKKMNNYYSYDSK